MRVYEITKQQDQAIKCYEDALSITREVGDRRREGWVLNVLGRVYSKQGEVEQGEKYYREAVRAIREAGDRWEEGKALHNIGSLYYFERRQYDVALAFLLSAIKVFEEIQSPRRKRTQRRVDALRREVGDEEFGVLLMEVEDKEQEIVERTLYEGV